MDQKLKIIEERSDVEWALSTVQGRRFIWRVLSDCGVYKDLEGEGQEVFKQIGRRQIGLHLLGIISDASEDRLFEMMREAKNRSIDEKEFYERANRTITEQYISDLPGYESGDSADF